MRLIDQFNRPTGFRQTLSAGFLAVGMTATVGTALIFEHVGGYIPCALCLQQRIPYYVAIPVALVALVAAAGRAPARITRLLFLAVGVIMLVSLYLAVVHAGIEWGYWAGPADCAQVGGGNLLGGDLLATIDAVRPPACDEAAGRFLGLSFAGWNALASALFAAVALRAAFARADRFA
jgi:disulfide bond formation protein DsbB